MTDHPDPELPGAGLPSPADPNAPGPTASSHPGDEPHDATPSAPEANPKHETSGFSGSPARPSGAPSELLELALADLRRNRAELEAEIKELESRRAVLQQELKSSFSGQSDAIARRLKGFQDYLVGALQELVIQAESMELVSQPLLVQPSPLDQQAQAAVVASQQAATVAAAGLFSQDEDLIRDRLERFQGQAEFYAEPWKLRRSLEPAGAALLEDWFLSQGGRGAQPSSGSRNRNALVTAAAIAILGELYGERLQTLVLAGQPERLGEWRRGLQDCLGLSREDFGPNSGVVLFERPDALIERADRLEDRGELPLIVVDAAEQVVDIPILQFPLWLAFAPGPAELTLEDDLL